MKPLKIFIGILIGLAAFIVAVGELFGLFLPDIFPKVTEYFRKHTQLGILSLIALVGIYTICVSKKAREKIGLVLNVCKRPLILIGIGTVGLLAFFLYIRISDSTQPSPTIPTNKSVYSEISPEFGNIPEELAKQLGSTILAGKAVLEDDGAYQEFQYGFLIFRGRVPSEHSIYVLSDQSPENSNVSATNYSQGYYKTYPNNWAYGRNPQVPGQLKPPKKGLYQPINGFGLEWYANPEVKKVGWGVTCEMSAQLLVQTFTKGMLVKVQDFNHCSFGELYCESEEIKHPHIGRIFIMLYSGDAGTRGVWYDLSDRAKFN